MLLFAKLSLMSSIYEDLETFCFSNESAVLEKLYHILIYTDSTSLKFLFISDPSSETPESKFREIIFGVITISKIYKRFDS